MSPHTVVTEARCPRCGGAFESGSVCPFCKAGVLFAGEGFATEAAQIPCPRCTAPHLWAIRLGEVIVDVCSECGGAWFDVGELEHVVQSARQDVKSGNLAVGRAPETAPGEHTGAELVYLKCPRCSTMMNRQNFERRSGIIVDRCPSHGVWLDGGELARVRAWIAQHPEGPPQPVDSGVKPYEFKESPLTMSAAPLGYRGRREGGPAGSAAEVVVRFIFRLFS